MSGEVVLQLEDKLIFLLDGTAKFSPEILRRAYGDCLAHRGLHAFPLLLLELDVVGAAIAEAVVHFLVDDGYHFESVLGLPVLPPLAVENAIEQILPHGQFGFGAVGQFLLAGEGGADIENGHIHAHAQLLDAVQQGALADLVVG